MDFLFDFSPEDRKNIEDLVEKRITELIERGGFKSQSEERDAVMALRDFGNRIKSYERGKTLLEEMDAVISEADEIIKAKE